MLNSIVDAAAHFYLKACGKLKCALRKLRGESPCYGFDVDLGRIDHPELEEKL